MHSQIISRFAGPCVVRGGGKGLDHEEDKDGDHDEEEEEDEEEEDDLGSIAEVKKFVWKKRAFVVKWRKSEVPTTEGASGVIADCPEETLRMIWESSRTNVRIADWINRLDGMVDVIERWDGGEWHGIERLASRMGWEGAFQVPVVAAANGADGNEASRVVANGATANEAGRVVARKDPSSGRKKRAPTTPQPQPRPSGRKKRAPTQPTPTPHTPKKTPEEESAFDSYRRSPVAPPQGVAYKTDSNDHGVLSEMEDSVQDSEEDTFMHVLCAFGHKWEELDTATYSCVVGRDCYKCGVSLEGTRRSNLAHHCMIPRCDITVCSICRGSYDQTTPPRTRRRGR